MRPQTIVERLDFVSKRINGLKFTPPTQLKPGDDQGYDCFMSCEMYYIEIKVDQSHQFVKDVVISHGNNAEGISCPVLRKVLADQDFETFAKHLAGLHSIYQINTQDKKVKQRAYPALTALETDLATLYDHQRRRTNNCHDLVHKSPIGIMEPRRGGLPVRLTYFVTPYDLVDINQKSIINLTLSDIIDKNLGLSATVEIEGSNHSHKLQVKSLISSQQNSSLPVYAPFNTQNSEKLPAQFVLKLSQLFPMLNTSIQQIINDVNEPATIKEYLTSLASTGKESIISLIARRELDLNKGPFSRSVDTLKNNSDLQDHVYSIKLLDQYHTYYILDDHLERPEGVYVTKIPFTHPTSIPIILKVLRQQAMFNFILGSCIRRNKSNSNTMTEEVTAKTMQQSDIFDIIPVNLSNVCVSFEHPSKESLATLEINFRDLSCQLYALDKESVCSNEFATKVLQKCLSIPITLRSVLKKCNERRLALLEDASKRREKELQDLLTNNSNQQGLQYKPHLQFQDTILQSKFNNLNEKSNTPDLNSIAELLSSKITNASTSDVSDPSNSNTDEVNSRSNLLKKFSCKPKTKQSSTTKNQAGILSLMLKRQNSTTSSMDDANLKATLTKKAKTKFATGESNSKSQPILTTTKLISTEVATAARLASKQAKQAISNLSTAIGINLTAQGTSTGPKQSDTTNTGSTSTNVNNIRIKPQSNGNQNGKFRKSSIGAVLDKLVGGVTPEQISITQNAATSNDNSDVSLKGADSKGSPLGAKSKSRIPADQFAIKQGSLGGLKLTVTKTKPAVPSSSNSTSTLTTQPSATIPSTTSTSTSLKSDPSKIFDIGSPVPAIKYTIPKISKTQQASQSSSNPADNQSSTTSETSQQNDESNNPTSSASNTTTTPSSSSNNKRLVPNLFNRTSSSNRNPVSSSTHPLGRTTSNPLANAGRPSSTSASENHSLNRISSSNHAPQIIRQQIRGLANLQQQSSQRLLNPGLINSQQQSNQMFALGLSQQQLPQSNPFQSPTDLNLLAANQAALLNQQQQQRFQNLNSLQQMPGPFMSSSVDANLISSSRPQYVTLPQPISLLPNSKILNMGETLQRPATSVITSTPQFYVRQPMFEDSSSAVSSTPRTGNEAQQPNLLDRKISESTLAPPTNTPVIPVINMQQANGGHLSSNSSKNEMSSTTTAGQPVVSNQGVSSSSDSGHQEVEPTISTPSSPTECGHAETIQPPPLIPIDSLDEPQASSSENDHPDDASDRLSIVDTNENIADSNSVASTPKPSSVNSPLYTQDSNSATPSSSSRAAETFPITSAIATNNVSELTSTETVTPSTRADSQVPSNSPTASTSSEVSTAQQSSSLQTVESTGHSRQPSQSSTSLAPSEEPIATQSSIVATTSDII